MAPTLAEVRWEDPPTKAGQGNAPDPELLAFAEALRAEPKRWAVWPRSYSKSTAANNAALSVRRGKQIGPGFEACVRAAVIYVRYVGTPDEVEP